eukprot:6742337-Lingulodinium_polyedra.AAC.1
MRKSSSIDCRPRREQFAMIHTHGAREVPKVARYARQDVEHKRALEVGAVRVVLEAVVAKAIAGQR